MPDGKRGYECKYLPRKIPVINCKLSTRKLRNPKIIILLGLISFSNPILKGQSVQYVVETDTIHSTYTDTTQAYAQARLLILDRIEKGHIYASIDQVTQDENLLQYVITLGPKFDVGVRKIESPGQTLHKVRLQGIYQEMQRILDLAATSGYPFAEIHVENIEIHEKKAWIDLIADYGPYIVFDTLEMLTEVTTRTSFLSTVLDMRPGKPYDESSFQNINRRIRQFEFLDLQRPPDIAFSGGKAKVYLDLHERRTNQFDGILGVLPNANSRNNSLITGYIDLNLKNLFRSGKQLGISWQRFNEESQSLDLRYRHPYMFGTHLDLNGQLKILKQDSTFVNRLIRIQIDKTYADLLFLGFDYRNESSTTLGEAKGASLTSYSTNWYGFGLSSIKQGPISTIGRDIRLNGKLHMGARTLNNTDSVDADKRSNSLRSELMVAGQIPIQKKGALYSRQSLYYMRNNNLLVNELERVGGLLSLRGFNENQFFVSTYWISQVDYRYYFESSSYLNVFFDMGWLKSDADSAEFTYWTKSFGAGMNLATRNGIFKFIFAGGFHGGQPLDVQNIKIHFGYATVF